MQQLTFMQQLAIWAIPIIFAITVHEVSHGWVALKLGDPTAKMLGRLTLNPIKHIDPVGTVLLPAILLYLGGVVFGWAKPVPVTWSNLRKPRRDMALVAIAGPIANLFMALGWALIIKLGLAMQSQWGNTAVLLTYMGQAGVMINLLLMVLNMIPIPPLDGSRVLSSLLPIKIASYFDRMEPMIGFIVLLALLASGILFKIMWPVVMIFRQFIFVLFGL